VGWDGSFAKDHPGVAAAGEIDDGGGGGAGGGAAVNDEWDLVAKLLLDAAGVGALGMAVQVGRGGGDGQAEAADDSARDGGFGHSESEVAGVGGDAEGELGAGLDDDCQRTGPELFGEAVEGGVELASYLVRLGDLGDEQREGLVAVDGLEIDGVDGEAVEGVGGKSDDIAVVEACDDVIDERWLGLVGMNTESFGRQIWLLCRLAGPLGPGLQSGECSLAP